MKLSPSLPFAIEINSHVSKIFTWMAVRCWTILILLSVSNAWASGFFKLDSGSFHSPQVIQSFLDNIESKLPSKMKQAFPEGVAVHFENLETAHGRSTNGKGITLNSRLIPVILAGPESAQPSLDPQGNIRTHKTDYQEAQATVIHETAHLYDFKNERPYDEKAFIQYCQQGASDPQLPLADNCEVYLNTRTTLSSDPYYLEVAGWPLSVQGRNYRETQNIFNKRSADPYEFKNPQEHFAVNFEYFILDPEFSCRKPVLNSFFQNHFQIRPFKSNCGPLHYVDPAAGSPSKMLKTIPMDRVYQIHYLFADRGSEMMSRWGHAMFRIVICAPERKTVGPECLNDEFYHLVLSFRGFINSFGISSWAGVTGKYPSRLFFVSLEEVKQSYNIDEFRDLVSYPLNLSQKEKELFIQRAVETHWSYDTKYYFLTNNCASESLNLLKSSVLRPELLDKKVIKPTELRDLLLKLHIASPIDTKNDRVAKFNQGYLFINHSERYLKSLAELTGQQEPISAVQNHLDSPFEKRQAVYQASGALTLKKIAAQVILETAALNKAKTKARSQVLSQALNSSRERGSWAESILQSWDKSIALFNLFSAPHELLNPDTYGIPSSEDISNTTEKMQKLWNENYQNSTNRKEQIKSLFTDEQTQEILNTENNLKKVQLQMINFR